MDWAKWQSKAAEMIEKYGAEITVRVYTNTGYSAASDEYTTKVQTDYNARALQTDVSENDANTSLVQVGDREMIVPALGLPNDLDKLQKVEIILGTITLNPIRIKPLSPGGDPIFYRILVRG